MYGRGGGKERQNSEFYNKNPLQGGIDFFADEND